ncbi:unnamed protein product, partial [Choristocarpus tenellus]
DFVVSFFVELSIMIMERLYLDPGTKEVSSWSWLSHQWKKKTSNHRR